MKTYAHELEDTSVRVNLVNPGPIRTAMRAKAFPGEDPDDAAAAVRFGAAVPGAGSPECAYSGRVVNFPDWQNEARHHRRLDRPVQSKSMTMLS